MQIEIMEPAKLTPYEKNPRLNEDAVASVAASIEKFGFNQPVVCNQENVICVGHTRWMAAQELGLKTIPVYKRKMTEKEFIAYNLADNRTNENSTWHDEVLSELIHELDELDTNMLAHTGFSDEELSSLLDDDLDEFMKQEEESTEEKNGPSATEKLRKYLGKDFFEIKLTFNKGEYEEIIELTKDYMEANKVETISECFKRLLLEWKK